MPLDEDQITEVVQSAHSAIRSIENSPPVDPDVREEASKQHLELFKELERLSDSVEAREAHPELGELLLTLIRQRRNALNPSTVPEFADNHRMLVVLRLFPQLMQRNEGIEGELKGAMLVARDQGFALAESAMANPANGYDKYQKLFNRLIEVHEAIIEYQFLDGPKLSKVQEEHEEYQRFRIYLQSQKNSQRAALSEFEKAKRFARQKDFEPLIEHVGKGRTEYAKLDRHFQKQVWNLIQSTRKELESARSEMRDLETKPRIRQITDEMVCLSEILLAREHHAVKPWGRFQDIYDFYKSIKFHNELLHREDIHAKLHELLLEAYLLGHDIITDHYQIRVFKEKPRVQAHFHSQFGEVCRLLTRFERGSPNEIHKYAEEAISNLQKTLTKDAQFRDKIFAYPRIAECQSLLGHIPQAISTYIDFEKMIDGKNIDKESVWAARRNRAMCNAILSRITLNSDESDKANKYQDESEKWFKSAARIWEPDADPVNKGCRSANNQLIHFDLMKLYQGQKRYAEAEKQANRCLDIQSEESTGEESIYVKTKIFLASALYQQGFDRLQEARRVLKTIEPDSTKSEQMIESLIMLRKIHIRENPDDSEELHAIDKVLKNYLVKLDIAEKNSVSNKLKDLLSVLLSSEEMEERNLLSVLLSSDEMEEYVQLCKARLRKPEEIVALINELALLVRASGIISPSGKQDHLLLSLKGECHSLLGEYELAISHLQRTLDSSPNPRNQGITWMQIGDVHTKAGDFKAAVDAYEESFRSGGQASAAPLLKAATACRLDGNYNQALSFIEQINDSGIDEKPIVTLSQKGSIYWSIFRDSKDNSDAKLAFNCFKSVLYNSGSADTIALRYMVQLLEAEYKPAEEYLIDILSDNTDPNALRLVLDALRITNRIPRRVFKTVIGRIEQAAEVKPELRELVGFLAVCLYRAYFSDSAMDITFTEATDDVARLISTLSISQKRAVLLEIMTTERHVLSAEIYAQYADHVLDLFSPVMRESYLEETSRRDEFIYSVNRFLLQEIPASLSPASYSGFDRFCVNSLKDDLDEILTRVRHRIEDSGSTCSLIRIDDSASIRHLDWIKLYPVLSALLSAPKVYDSHNHANFSLFSIAEEPWHLEVDHEGSTLKVSISWSSSENTEKSLQLLEEIREKLTIYSCYLNESINDIAIELSEMSLSEDNILAAVTISFTRSPNDQSPSEIDRFQGFFRTLEKETERLIETFEGTRADFYHEANNSFPGAADKVWSDKELDWACFLNYFYDTQFSFTLDSICSSDNFRPIVHELKSLCSELMNSRNNIELLGQTRDMLQETLESLLVFSNQTIGSPSAQTCALHTVLENTVRSLMNEQLKATVKLNLNSGNMIYASIHPKLFEMVTIDLMANAINAVQMDDADEKYIDIQLLRDINEDGNETGASLTIKNSYDPEKENQHGTGIGLKVVKKIVNEVYKGKVLPLPNPKSRQYSIRVTLPLIAH